MRILIGLSLMLVSAMATAAEWPTPPGAPRVLGQSLTPPANQLPIKAGAPSLYAHSDDVLPDQSFVLSGDGLDDAELFCWGPSATERGGQRWPVKIQTRTANTLIATIPEAAPAGVYILWAGRGGAWSAPIRLNAPQLWWTSSDSASPGETVRIAGRNLAHKPDSSTASLYLTGVGGARWLVPAQTDKYFLDASIPAGIAPGQYQLWVHAGSGGELGWSNPLPLVVRSAPIGKPPRRWDGKDPVRLQAMLHETSRAGGGTVTVPAGRFVIPTTLEVPAGVRVTGESRTGTILALESDPSGVLPHTGTSPAERRAAVWIKGANAGLARLTIAANARVNWGLIAEHPDGLTWIAGPSLEDVRIEGSDSRGGESGAIRLQHVTGSKIVNSELHGRAPIFLSGARQGWFVHNRLIAASRYGGGAEGAILARTEPLERCVFEDNVIANPVGGTPQVRRLIWVSTGKGSVNDNLFLRNRAENPRFSGVAATDQNVGETILLESRMRYAYFGPPASVDDRSVTIPADAPFVPPAIENDSPEPPASEYYAVIAAGRGLGQVRRVVKSESRRFILDSAWRVRPDANSRILITTLFARNLILENEAIDGMSGIQLWIGGWENVIARNRIARQRKQGIYLYASTNPIAVQMPQTWNRGIGILLFTTVEENQIENTLDGIYLNSNNAKEPVDWPRSIGTVIRRNTAVASRASGIRVTSGGTPSPQSVTGSVAEFNLLRDQPVAVGVAQSTSTTLVRRNIAYVWDPSLLLQKPIGLQLLGENVQALENDFEPKPR